MEMSLSLFSSFFGDPWMYVYISPGCRMMRGQAERVKGKVRWLHTGITVDRAWLFIIVPLNHGDGKGKV